MAEQIEVGKVYVPFEVDQAPLDAELRRIEREARATGRRAGAGFGEGAKEVGGFGVNIKAAGTAVAGLALIVADKGIGALRGLTGWVGRTSAGLVDLGSVGVLKVAAGLRAMAEDTRNAEGELSALGKTGYVAASGLETVAKVALTISGVITGLQLAVAGASAAFVVMAHRAAADFAPSWNRVLTVLGETREGFRGLRDEVSGLAGEIGVDGREASDVLYEIFGAMPQLLDEPTRALGLLRRSLQVGTTEFGTAAEAASLATGIINAFGLEVEDSTEILDKFWAAQGAGKFTFGEVAQEAGAVAASISALGGSYEDMLAILATTTPLNIPVPEAVTQIQSALAGLISNAPVAQKAARELGVEFNASTIRAKGLAGALLDIIEATEGDPTLLRRFFPDRQGLDLMIQLAGRTDQLRQRIEEINNAGGEHERIVRQMNEGWEAQKRILGREYQSVLRGIGMEFEGVGVAGVSAMSNILRAIGDVLEKERELRREINLLPALWERVGDQRPESGAGLGRNAGMGVLGSRASAGRAPFRLPGMTAGAPEEFAGVPEPATIDYARQKIEDLRSSLQATAVAQYAATRNVDAYEKATRQADERINQLILSEVARLRAAGATEVVLNELITSYKVLGEETDRAAAAQRKAAESLVEMALNRRLSEAERYIAQLREWAEAARSIKQVGLAGELEAEAVAMERLNGLLAGFTPNVTRPRTLGVSDPGPSVGALTEQFNRETADLKEKLARELIDPDEFERLGREAAERFRAGILSKIDALRAAGKLTREEYQKLVELLPEIATSSDDMARRAAETAREYANVARAVLSVASAMGEVDDETRQVLEGVVLLVENVAVMGTALKAGTALSMGAVVGAIGGVAALISAFSGAAERNREALLRNMESAHTLTIALRELRDAVLTDISSTQKQAILTEGEDFIRRLSGIEDFIAGAPGGDGKFSIRGMSQADFDFLSRLEALTNLEFFDQATGEIDWAAFKAAWDGFKEVDVGAFANDLTGRLDALDYLASQAGDALGTAADQMARFIETVRTFSPEFAAEFDRILNEQGADAARAWLQQQAILFAQPGGASNLGGWAQGLTAAEIQRIIQEGLERTDAMTGGVTGGGSTRLNVSMTEVQANVQLSLLGTIAYNTGGMLARMTGGAVLAPPQLPTGYAPPSLASLGMALQGGGNFTMGDVYVEISVPSGDPTQLAQWNQAGREIGVGIRSGFGRDNLGRQIADMAAGAGIDRARVQIRPRR